MKTIVSVALVLCLAMTALLGSTAEVQAASYKKTITKTVTLKGGKVCKFYVDTKKKDKSINVKFTATGAVKGMNVQIIAQDLNNSGTMTKKNMTLKAKQEVNPGEHEIYIANYGTGKVKLKITVTSKTANLKYKSFKMYSVEG